MFSVNTWVETKKIHFTGLYYYNKATKSYDYCHGKHICPLLSGVGLQIGQAMFNRNELLVEINKSKAPSILKTMHVNHIINR